MRTMLADEALDLMTHWGHHTCDIEAERLVDALLETLRSEVPKSDTIVGHGIVAYNGKCEESFVAMIDAIKAGA